MHRLFALLAVTVPAALILPAQADGGTLNRLDGYYIAAADLTLRDSGFRGEDDGDGFGIKGRAQFADRLFFSGEYQQVEYDDSDLEVDQLRAGIGGYSALSPSAGFVLRGEFLRLELDAPFSGGSESDNGYAVHAGLEGHLSPQVLLHGSIGFVSVDDADGPEFLVGVRLQGGGGLSLFADYRSTQLEDGSTEIDLDDLRIGVGLLF